MARTIKGLPVFEDTREFTKQLVDFKIEMDRINAQQVARSRAKTVLLVDVETIGVSERLCYDISWAIIRGGKVLRKRAYCVREVFCNMQTMSQAYYFNKYNKYLEMISKGIFEIKNMLTIVDKINSDIEEFGVTVFTAFNSSFDTEALQYTIGALSCPRNITPVPNQECVWVYAVNTLLNRPSYRQFAKEHNLKTASGKYWQSNAEATYRYITNNPMFEEEHVGVMDVTIEAEIMMYADRQRVKADKIPTPTIWQKMKIGEGGL